MAQIGLFAGAVDSGGYGEGRVHENHCGTHVRQIVLDALGVVAGDGSAGEERGEQPGADRGDFVEVQVAGRPCRARTRPSLRACRCRRRARARRRPGGWRRPGARHRRVGAGSRTAGGGPAFRIAWCGRARARRLRRRNRASCGGRRRRRRRVAQGAAVAADEHDDSGLGGLVGVLPEPCAFGVAGAMRAGHGAAKGGGVQGPAGFEEGEEKGGRGEKGGGAIGEWVAGRGCGDGCGGGRGASRGVRRRDGVEHENLRVRAWKSAGRDVPASVRPGEGGFARGGRGCGS